MLFYFLLKYGQIEKAHRKAAGFEGMLSQFKKSYSKFKIETLKKHLEKQNRGENKVHWSLNPDTS